MSSAAAYEMGSVMEEPFSWQLSAICPASCVACSNVLYSVIQRNFRSNGGIGVV